MATATPSPKSAGVVSRDVTWDDYEAQLRIVGERPIRVTYDQGTMEVLMPSFGHEDEAYRLGRMVDTLTEELEIAVKAGRTTTQKRQDLDRGAEPDQCYWLGDRTPDGREAATRSDDRPGANPGHRGRHHPEFARPAGDLRGPGHPRGLASRHQVFPIPRPPT